MSVSRHIVEQISMQPGDTFHITPMSDLHLESSCCNVRGLREFIKERSQLPHHRFVVIGDVLDMIAAGGDRRYQKSVHIPELADTDSWVNEAIQYAFEILAVPNAVYTMLSPGNHELEYTKRHGFDPISVLCDKLGAQRGGYSGVIDWRVDVNGHTGRLRALFHHGAWGGRYAKGYNGAQHFFHRFDGWNVALYGHNHASTVDKETRQRAKKGELIKYNAYIINCGSWTDGYRKDASSTHYTERAGYVPQPTDSPLIRVTMPRVATAQLEYRVET